MNETGKIHNMLPEVANNLIEEISEARVAAIQHFKNASMDKAIRSDARKLSELTDALFEYIEVLDESKRLLETTLATELKKVVK